MHYSRRDHRTFALVCLLTCALGAGPAHADQSEAQRSGARELGTLGMQAYFDKDYARAADHLDRAYRLFSTPTLGLWSARAWIEVGSWVRAAERLREAQFASAAVGDNAAQRQAQADATEELKALEPRIPRLTVAIAGAAPTAVTLHIDDVAIAPELIGIAHPIDPGPHKIVGIHEDQRVELEVTLQANETQVAQLTFEPKPEPKPEAALPAVSPPVHVPAATPDPPSNAMRIAAITSLSVAGASLATSLVLTWLGLNKLHDCDKRDGDYYCSDREADAYEAYRGVASATFYGGTALAGAGLALWLLQPSAADQKLSVALRPLGAELTVKF